MINVVTYFYNRGWPTFGLNGLAFFPLKHEPRQRKSARESVFQSKLSPAVRCCEGAPRDVQKEKKDLRGGWITLCDIGGNVCEIINTLIYAFIFLVWHYKLNIERSMNKSEIATTYF